MGRIIESNEVEEFKCGKKKALKRKKIEKLATSFSFGSILRVCSYFIKLRSRTLYIPLVFQVK